MARHNREGHGTDQKGFEYEIGYQPDWLRVVKVTRGLESGRQSSKTLFRNPEARAKESCGNKVRTRIVSQKLGLDFEITVDDPQHVVTRVRVTCKLSGEDRKGEVRAKIRGQFVEGHPGVGDGDEIEFTIEDSLPPPEPPRKKDKKDKDGKEKGKGGR